jgi:type IV pilus biogenesis protein CpaD/CtpE
MDVSKLNRLRQIEIPTKCPEDWEAMDGGEAKRFCSGCSCFVHNLSAMKANEAEQVLNTPERVCARITVDANRGVLTKDGWIPRLLLAGAVAASVAGCAPQAFQGEANMPSQVQGSKPNTSQEKTMGKVAVSQVQVEMGDIAPPNQRLGRIIKQTKPVKSKPVKNPKL